MSAGQFGTAEEDTAMWRFAMEEHPGYGRKTQWELFKKTTGSKRTVSCLYTRLTRILLPELSKTKFHVKTKLMLCQKYDVKVDDEFLKELEKEAEVDLNQDRTVNSYQLKPNCPKNRDLEMGDEEFKKITSLIPKLKLWTSEEEAEIWSYVLENSEECTRGKEVFWKDLVAKMNWNRTPKALMNRFLTKMAPNLHEKNLPIEQKLELYKRCQIPVNRKYLETLKEHAKLKIDEDRCITKYKMKTNRPEKRKNAEGTSRHVKKTKRVVPEESSDDQDEDEDVGFDDIVPGTDIRRAKKARKESPEPASEAQDDDVILDNVVNRGWTNPDRIIRKPPKIEVDDDKEPTFDQLFDSPVEAEQDEDSIMDLFEPKSEVFEQDPVLFEYNEAFCEVEQEQTRDNQSDSIAQMLDVMKRMEKTIEDQRNEFVKDREASEKRVVALSRAVVAMKNQAKKREEVFKEEMSVLQKEVNIMRNEVKAALPDDPTASNKKKYLLNLKKQASLLESPEMDEIVKKIDEMIGKLPDNDKSPLPTNLLIGNFINQLAALGN